jgi:photosystem II stability/assembly factor-like uncharacterized protein
MKFVIIFFSLLLGKKCFAQWETVYFPVAPGDSAILPGLNSVRFINENKGIAVGTGASDQNPWIIRTIDKGDSWDSVYTNSESMILQKIVFTDSLTAFVAGQGLSDGIILKTTDFGNTWDTSIFNHMLTSISFPSPNIGYAVGDDGFIIKTIDSGMTWNAQSSPVFARLTDVYFLNDTLGFICGGGYMLRTMNGGNSWDSTMITNSLFYSGNIHFPSQNRGYFFLNDSWANQNQIYTTTDLGLTWTLLPGTSNTWFSTKLFFTNDSTGYIAGIYDISKTTDYGLTWTAQSSSAPSMGNFYDWVGDIFFIDENKGFAVGYSQFYRTFNGGELVTTAVETQSTGNKTIIYPNPSNGSFTLEHKIEDANLIIYCIDGAKLKTIRLGGTNKVNIDAQELPSGLYIYQIESKLETMSGKLIIIK